MALVCPSLRVNLSSKSGQCSIAKAPVSAPTIWMSLPLGPVTHYSYYWANILAYWDFGTRVTPFHWFLQFQCVFGYGMALVFPSVRKSVLSNSSGHLSVPATSAAIAPISWRSNCWRAKPGLQLKYSSGYGIALVLPSLRVILSSKSGQCSSPLISVPRLLWVPL